MGEDLQWYEKVENIYNHLQDEESKTLFNARFDFLTMGEDAFFDDIGSYYHDWINRDGLLDPLNERQLVVCGSGHDGKITKKLLDYWGYKVICFYDKFKKGTIDGIEILSLEEIKKKYEDIKFVVSSIKFKYEIFYDLVIGGINKEEIVMPQYRYIYSVRGNQYFDVFQPQKDEIFIDAGAFDGKTTLDFLKWTKSNYKEIIVFEPINKMYEKIVEHFSNFTNINIYNYAVWDKEDKILFSEAGVGSHQNDEGDITVKAIDIDHVVGDKKVTYIKLDVEGSEMNALIGASNTIKKNHPKLAICIYHKQVDFIELSAYVLSLFPGYKLYIRHYTSFVWETVLYAIAE